MKTMPATKKEGELAAVFKPATQMPATKKPATN
jgi:hypothetical protein